jgi:hypothetical protein
VPGLGPRHEQHFRHEDFVDESASNLVRARPKLLPLPGRQALQPLLDLPHGHGLAGHTKNHR